MFEVNIVATQKQAQFVTVFVFYKFPIVPNSFIAPPALPLFRRPWLQVNKCCR